MPDVRVTVDGREVFARDCTDFECEHTAQGEFTARGSFTPVEHHVGYRVTAKPPAERTAINIPGLLEMFGLDGKVFKDPTELIRDRELPA